MTAYDTFTAEIRSNIAPVLKSTLDADQYARGIVEGLDYTDDSAHIEVRGLHTKTGAPHSFWVNIPAELYEGE